MITTFEHLADAWVRRRAAPEPEALRAIQGLEPAAVVTGGSRGIGRAIAEELARHGHRVLIVARRPGDLETARQAVERAGTGPALILSLDVTEPTAGACIEEALASERLYLDTLVNSAGIGLSGRFTGQTTADLDRLVALDVTALTRLTHHALKSMLPRARGNILNVASLGAYMPGPYQAAYYASKSYVLSLTEALAEETAGRGVRIAVLAPGPVATGFHRDMGADTAIYLRALPVMSPERVARSAVRGLRLARRVIVPGLAGPFIAYALRVLPRPVIRPLVGGLLQPDDRPQTPRAR